MDYAYTTQNSLGWHKMRNRKAARPRTPIPGNHADVNPEAGSEDTPYQLSSPLLNHRVGGGVSKRLFSSHPRFFIFFCSGCYIFTHVTVNQ
ncbi:hypothetical protein F2P79_010567 [Pimephales promelas]|nr:hypothetical protein F2P79_010567 [Pimephales promelas]